MSQVVVKHLEGTTFVARGETNHWLAMDTKVENGGSNGASTPMELVLFGLGGCTAVDVESILRKMKVDVERFQVDLDFERCADHPKVYTSIDMNFRFWGKDLPQDRLERAVQLSEDKYCSVAAMLRPNVDIKIKVENNNTA